MHSFILSNITPAKLLQVLQKLASTGNTVESISPMLFSLSGNGIRAQVQYDATKQEARVAILDKPFLVPASLIERKVREAVGA